MIFARLLSNSNKTEGIFAEISFKKTKWLISAFSNSYKVTSETICTIQAKLQAIILEIIIPIGKYSFFRGP